MKPTQGAKNSATRIDLPNFSNDGRSLIGALAEIPSPVTGFTVASLLDIARQHGIRVDAMARVSGEELIVPSVIHWKQNHYAAITERRGDLYLVHDPTFGGPQWLRANVINEEASGNFLVPAGRRPANYRTLSTEEAELIYGKGYNIEDPPPAPPTCPEEGQDPCDCPPGGGGPGGGGPGGGGPGGGGPGGGGPGGGPRGGGNCDGCGPINNVGCPTWTVTEPYISLWLHDQPMNYKTSLGTDVALKLSYHQRETRPADGNVFNLGPYWNCNWLSYLDVSDFYDDPGFEFYDATLYGSNGGERTYTYFDTDVPEYRSRTRFERWIQEFSLLGFRIVHPNGSQVLYGLLIEVSSTPMRTLAFPTLSVDAQGRYTQFVYSTNNGLIRLTQVLDVDGRTNVVRYTGTTETTIEEIESPDGKLVQFQYDAEGLLTNIVDAVGINSSFAYTETNSVFVLTQLTTPYGTTGFGYLRPTEGLYYDTADDNINRAITVTQPDGGKHLFMYRDNCYWLYRDDEWQLFLPHCYEDKPDLPISGFCDDDDWGVVHDLGNFYMYHRNSFLDRQASRWSAIILATATTRSMRAMTP